MASDDAVAADYFTMVASLTQIKIALIKPLRLVYRHSSRLGLPGSGGCYLTQPTNKHEDLIYD